MYLALWVPVGGFLGVCIFSVLLLMCTNLLMMWLIIELMTLCLIPVFYFGWLGEIYDSLFCYIIVAGISSSLLLIGWLHPSIVWLVLLSFIIKFGVFPFFWWVYVVLLKSSWGVVFLVSGVVKVSFCVLYIMWGGSELVLMSFMCSATFIIVGFLFWIQTYSWSRCWAHMVIASSASLLIISCNLSLEVVLDLYIIYFVWVSGVLLFFGDSRWSVGVEMQSWPLFVSFLYCFFLLVTPVSLGMVYKVLSCYCLSSCSWWVLASWVFYSISEQIYLFGLFFSKSKGGSNTFSMLWWV